MKIWIGVTDHPWFEQLAAMGSDEVNFWQHGSSPHELPRRENHGKLKSSGSWTRVFEGCSGGSLQDSLAALITETSLARLAGGKSFARGVGYFESGAVIDLVQTKGTVTARVIGGDEYRVQLRPVRGTLQGSCTCPMGNEGNFCKHAVAVGLAWLARGEGGDDLADVRAYLEAESQASLLEVIVEQATSDPLLRSRLQAAAMRRRPPSNLKALKDAVRKSFATSGFVDYHGMRAFVERANAVEDLLRGLLENRRAAEAAALAEHALRLGIAAYEETDDSDGGFGETLHRIAALHLEACRAAKTDPEALAGSLFELMMLDQWGFFEIGNCAPLLEEKGLARFRALAEAAWKKVPAREPGARREVGTRHYLVTGIMEALARRDGDLDALIAVKSRDLSYSHAFTEIAEALAKARRHEEALAWAERGRNAFPNELNVPLADFLVAAYHRAKRHEDAVRIAWEDFTRHTGLGTYQRLEKSAGRARNWKSWREMALDHVRAELNRPDRSRGMWHQTAGGKTLLVEIFLHEGDSDAALAEAKSGGCRRDVWMQLARARERDHPLDAAAIYRDSIDAIVDRKHNQAYDEAAELAGKIKALLARAGNTEEFAAWLEALRAKHKAKRNFMKRVEGLK